MTELAYAAGLLIITMYLGRFFHRMSWIIAEEWCNFIEVLLLVIILIDVGVTVTLHHA